MAKSKIKKYKDGDGYQDESGKSISKAEAAKRDKNLTESIKGYSAYEKQQAEKKKNLSEEASRQAKLKYPAAASTYVKKPQVKMKLGGSCSTPKRLKK